MRRALGLTTVFLCLVVGCDEEVSADTDPGDAGGPTATPGTVVLLADVDPEPLCNTVGVTEVRLVARRIGCESPPPAPCTLPANPPTIEGDRRACPITDPTLLLGVEVDQAGRYEVQTEVEFTTGDTEARCHTLGGDPEVLVPAEDVEAGAVRMLDDGDVACP